MTPLRRRMIDDMTLRNFTKATIDAYVRAVARFALHFHCSPDLLGREHVRSYLLHLLQEQHVSHSYYKLTRCALRFFYRETLGRDDVPASLAPSSSPAPSRSSSAPTSWPASSPPSGTSSTAPCS